MWGEGVEVLGGDGGGRGEAAMVMDHAGQGAARRKGGW